MSTIKILWFVVFCLVSCDSAQACSAGSATFYGMKPYHITNSVRELLDETSIVEAEVISVRVADKEKMIAQNKGANVSRIVESSNRMLEIKIHDIIDGNSPEHEEMTVFAHFGDVNGGCGQKVKVGDIDFFAIGKSKSNWLLISRTGWTIKDSKGQ